MNKNKIGDLKRKLFQYAPQKITLALNAIRNGMPTATVGRDFYVSQKILQFQLYKC